MDDSHSDAVKGAFAMQAMGTLDVDEAASMLMPMVGKAGAAMKAAAGVKSNSTALVPAGGNGESGGGSDVLTSKRKRREQQSHQLKTLQAGQRVMCPSS